MAPENEPAWWLAVQLEKLEIAGAEDSNPAVLRMGLMVLGGAHLLRAGQMRYLIDWGNCEGMADLMGVFREDRNINQFGRTLHATVPS